MTTVLVLLSFLPTIRIATTFLLAALMLGLVNFSACSKQGPTKLVHSLKNVGNEVGKNVTVRGTAQNAKLGAIVLVEDLLIYVAGLDGWKATLMGKRLTGLAPGWWTWSEIECDTESAMPEATGNQTDEAAT